MKILLITFDKDMEQKVRSLLKDHQIITAKNGEEALLLNVANDVDIVIYDALAGGIAEEDINRLYDEGFNNVPFIILMDDLFPIDPENVKPKIKKIISREVEVDKLPRLVEEMAAKKQESAAAPQQTETPTQTAASPSATEEKEEATTTAATQEATTWEELFGALEADTPAKEQTEQKEAAPPTPEPTPAQTAQPQQPQPQEEKEKKEEPQPVAATTSETQREGEVSLNKQCLLVSFDMSLVEQIEKLIGDKCDLHIARSAKQALKKYAGRPFDIIIFDTISGVFAEKGIRDLYEKGGYKDPLYVLLLDEFLPLDVDRLPVKNLRAIKRESELFMLPEIVENAPHITLGVTLPPAGQEEEESAPATVSAPSPTPTTQETKKETQKETTLAETTQPPQEEKSQPTAEEKTPPAPATPQTAQQTAPPAPAATAPTAQPTAAAPPAAALPLSKEEIEELVEEKVKQLVLPFVEELIRSKLSEIYIKAVVREIVEPQVDEALIKEVVREIAEPLVKETLEQLLS